MSTFNVRKILVPIDFSKTSLMALDYATSMAKLYKASVILLHVFEDFVYNVDLPLSLASLKEIEGYHEAIENKLADIADKARRDYSIRVSHMRMSGKPRTAIISTANSEDVDIIIMGTHGVSGLERIFLGSNTYRVISEVECPVLAVQTPIGPRGFNRILIPIDNSHHSHEKVKYAVDVALKYDANIIVSGLLTENDIPYTFDFKINQIKEYLISLNIPFETEIVLTEDYLTTTLEQIKKHKANLIIILSEDSLLSPIISTYSQQVINQSKIAVMCIKPTETYVSFPTLKGTAH